MNILEKKLAVFDCDSTLAPSKNPMEPTMNALLVELLKYLPVAVIGGGKYELIKYQLLDELNIAPELLAKINLFPNSGSRMFSYQAGEWQQVYGNILTADEVQKIYEAFDKAYVDINYVTPDTLYGEVLENRGTQVSFSVFGQNTPLAIKEEYSGSLNDRRLELKAALDKYLPEFEVRVAGLTTIDITRKGIDKAYGIKQIEERLHVTQSQMVFVGDALFPGGNDEPVKLLGVDCLAVTGPKDTEKIIESWLQQLRQRPV